MTQNRTSADTGPSRRVNRRTSRPSTSEKGRAALGLRSSLYRPLDPTAVAKIASDAFRLLADGGIEVHSDTAIAAFRRAGAQVDESSRVVRLPQALVEDAIASNPSKITLHSRNRANDAVLEEDRVHYGTGGTAIYVLDPDTGVRRPSTLDDVVLNARIVDQLDNVHVFTINVFPNDIENTDHIDVNRFFHSFDNTTKHVMGGLYSLAGCKKVVEMASTIAGGREVLRNEPFASFITLIVSPFKIDDEYGEMTCYLAGEGLPVVVPTEPICGTTAPITLAANVLAHVAETLAGITLVQCVQRKAPGICGSVGSITNLRTMAHVGGAVERGIINAAVSQMAQHFSLPYYSTAGCTDAKELDLQAVYETAISNLLVAMSGANYIHDSAGLMESDLTVSYEKLIVDDEILGMCQRVLRGIEVNDETLATDLMIEKGPGQDFLAEPHTVRFMRSEFFEPRLSNRERRDAYDSAEHATLSRAKAIVQEIRRTKPESQLDPKLREAIVQRFGELRLREK
jgi:trimethylamine--corrinoid protein Co-methyltransferase